MRPLAIALRDYKSYKTPVNDQSRDNIACIAAIGKLENVYIYHCWHGSVSFWAICRNLWLFRPGLYAIIKMHGLSDWSNMTQWAHRLFSHQSKWQNIWGHHRLLSLHCFIWTVRSLEKKYIPQQWPEYICRVKRSILFTCFNVYMLFAMSMIYYSGYMP